MRQIQVTFNIDEDTVKEEAGLSNLSEAIGRELRWLNDSGIYVDHWSYLEPEKERGTPEEPTVAELIVRLSYFAGALEANKEISAPEWNDLRLAISECITAYYDKEAMMAPSSIEEVADRLFRDMFPVDPARDEHSRAVPETGINSSVPDEFVVRLAHLAGELEASDRIHPMDWDDLNAAIRTMIDAYQNDYSESSNPFCLEDAGERYFINQFGKDEFREVAMRDGWASKTPAELIAEAKATWRHVPNQSEQEVSVPEEPPKAQTDYEYDKVILRDNATNDLYVFDAVDKADFEHENESANLLWAKTSTIVGVYPSPECLAGYHPSSISAIWDDIPADFRDTPNEEALANIAPGKVYDVCYYYTKENEPGDLYSGVDCGLSREAILRNIKKNKYIEGATIHETSRILTGEEYLNGMRRNRDECRSMMDPDQLFEVSEGVEHGVAESLLLRPELSAPDLLVLRTELETELAREGNPLERFEVTDYGPEELHLGFKSVSNFEKYPDRVCYIPDNWDFADGPGITGKEILDLCAGDKLKAKMVFDLCDWQFPSTILGEWDHEDDLALENIKRAELLKHPPRSFQDILQDAHARAASNQEQQIDPDKHR